MKPIAKLALALFLPLSACGRADGQPGAAAPPPVVDSVLPMEEAMRRFRADLPAAPAALDGGLASRDAVVDAVVRSLARGDTAAFERLAITRAEFAYLYYPATPMARPPYDLPPALAWFQLRETSRKGLSRALRRFGGRPWTLERYRCEEAPAVQGENRLWGDCTVTLGSVDGSAPVVTRLFGAILERDGRYKVLSYENDL